MHSRWIVWTLPLLAAGLLLGQTSTGRRLVANKDDIDIQPLTGHIPRWTGSRLVGCDDHQGGPILWTVDRQGNREDVALDVAGANYIQVWDVASGPDGALAAVGYAISGDSRLADFVAWISPDRTRQVLTQVKPYVPYVVTVAPDGTIWTVGAARDDASRVDLHPNVLRHYTPSGQLLASTVVRGTRPTSTGVVNVNIASTLMASNDRIGWLTFGCEYIEFSFDATEVGRYTCPNRIAKPIDLGGVALSSADDLLVGGKALGPLAPLELDRAAKTWNLVPVSQDSGNSLGLLGFDGLTLVTRHAGAWKVRRFNWAQDALAEAGQ
jgi:hypothetical protein